MASREMEDEQKKADWYQERAEETRTMAESAEDRQARETLISVAENYEKLADIWDRVAKKKLPQIAN